VVSGVFTGSFIEAAVVDIAIKRWLTQCCGCLFPHWAGPHATGMADEGGDGGPYPMPAVPSAGLETAGESSSAVEEGADLPPPQPGPDRQFDRRGNDVAATQRESIWSVVLLQDLSQENVALMKSHVLSLIEKGRAIEQGFEEIALDLYEEDEGFLRRNLGASQSVEDVMESLPEGADAASVFHRLLDETSGRFRALVDLVGHLENLEDPDRAAIARDLSIFIDRGRRRIPDDAMSIDSHHNAHAGISDKDHRPQIVENFFPGKIDHAKSAYEKIEDSETYRKFVENGIPFVSGVSGVMQQLCVIMEMDKGRESLSDFEWSERERILAMHAARMVAGGSHSVMECLLPAMAYGYFADVPDPMTPGVGYATSITALEDHLQRIGLDGSRALSA
jgi:hypothetical protein